MLRRAVFYTLEPCSLRSVALFSHLQPLHHLVMGRQLGGVVQGGQLGAAVFAFQGRLQQEVAEGGVFGQQGPWL